MVLVWNQLSALTLKPVQLFIMLASFERGLRLRSEQTGENVHHDFNETWKNFQITDVERPIYTKHLLHAMSLYNNKFI